jgi:hypothetical protein
MGSGKPQSPADPAVFLFSLHLRSSLLKAPHCRSPSRCQLRDSFPRRPPLTPLLGSPSLPMLVGGKQLLRLVLHLRTNVLPKHRDQVGVCPHATIGVPSSPKTCFYTLTTQLSHLNYPDSKEIFLSSNQKPPKSFG